MITATKLKQSISTVREMQMNFLICWSTASADVYYGLIAISIFFSLNSTVANTNKIDYSITNSTVSDINL